MLPLAHDSEPTTSAPQARSTAAPLDVRAPMPPALHTRPPIPSEPTTSPATVRRDGLTPCGRSQSTVTIHMGTLETIRADSPLGTRCDAQLTMPLPDASNMVPTMAAMAHCFSVGRGAPRSRDHV
jgi:hypothetical protein